MAVFALTNSTDAVVGTELDDLIVADSASWNPSDIVFGNGGFDTFSAFLQTGEGGGAVESGALNGVERVLLQTLGLETSYRADFINSTGIQEMWFDRGESDLTVTALRENITIGVRGDDLRGGADVTYRVDYIPAVAGGANDVVTLALDAAVIDQVLLNKQFEGLSIVLGSVFGAGAGSEVDEIFTQTLRDVTIGGDGPLTLGRVTNGSLTGVVSTAALASLDTTAMTGDFTLFELLVANNGTVALGSGNDRLESVVTQGTTASVALGAGNDYVDFDSFVSTPAFDAGEGNDEIDFDLGLGMSGFGAQLLLGTGNDNAFIGGSGLSSDSSDQVSLGDGNDVFTVAAGNVTLALLDGGLGNDSIGLAGSFFGALDGGAGNDLIDVDGGFSGTVDLDTGDDALALGTGVASSINNTTVTGGTGADFVQINAGTVRNLTVVLGDGNDDLQLTANLLAKFVAQDATALTVLAGTGNDNVAVNGLLDAGAAPFASTPFVFNMDIGNDTLSLAGVTEDPVTIAMGNGADRLTLDAVFETTVANGDGGLDTLRLSSQVARDLLSIVEQINGFETLAITDSLVHSIRPNTVGQVTRVVLEQGYGDLDGVAENFVIRIAPGNPANPNTVELQTGRNGGLDTLVIDGINAAGTADAFTVELTGGGSRDFGRIALPAFEALEITANGTSPFFTDLYELDIAPNTFLTSLVINGSADRLDLTGQAIFSDIQTVNASAFAGGVALAISQGLASGVSIAGAQGSDTITGSVSADTILGGTGNDQLFGSQGLDTIEGGDGSDLLSGGAQNDLLVDSLVGNGFDAFQGGGGNDTMTDANDTLTSTFRFEASSAANGEDVITGFNAGNNRDVLIVSDFLGTITTEVLNRNAQSPNVQLTDGGVYAVTLGGNLGNKNYGEPANFGELFGNGTGQFSTTIAAGSEAVVAVRSGANAQIYFVDDFNSDGILTAADVDRVAVVSLTSNTAFDAFNFA